jgi:hypothetical protein
VNFPKVSKITAMDLLDGTSMLLIVREGIYSNTAYHSLFSEFQLRSVGAKVDSICQRHDGIQKMVIQS